MALALPIYFSQPSGEVLRQLSAFLEELPIVSERELLNLQAWREDVPIIGNNAEIVAVVEDSLKRDYAENIAEAESVPYFFDYQIDEFWLPDAESVQGLGIHTRLISYDPQDGKILYGRTVYRTAQDRFVCWQ